MIRGRFLFTMIGRMVPENPVSPRSDGHNFILGACILSAPGLVTATRSSGNASGWRGCISSSIREIRVLSC
jgi:hypothetical protein